MIKSTSGVVTSTTGTAPILFSPSHVPGQVRIALEDGSEQTYSTADLLSALQAIGVLTGEAVGTDA